MGMYDTYGERESQLKVGPCLLHHYKLGDTVLIDDGVYVSFERMIVIKHHIFVADMDVNDVFDNHGMRIAYRLQESPS